MKKKTIAIFVSCAFLMVAVFSLASAATNGQPFNAIQNSLDKLQAQIDKLSQDFSNFNTGGVHRVEYMGTLPDNLNNPDKVVDTVVETELGAYHLYYYFKIVNIPEIDTSDMPQVSIYLKAFDRITDGLGNDTWQIANDNIFVKDGAVYFLYASDSSGNPYGGWLEYGDLGGRDYKIVVVY
ncbi:MAG: hypothetical protein Q8K92_12130 [Leadbetterella sp.]|nr:hypothetical protein [Leadbetterella sp.]